MKLFHRVLLLAGWLLGADVVAGAPLPSQVYVWQREWTDSVKASVKDHATNFTELAVLAGGGSLGEKKPPPGGGGEDRSPGSGAGKSAGGFGAPGRAVSRRSFDQHYHHQLHRQP